MKKRDMKNWLVLSSVSVALMVACGKSATPPGAPTVNAGTGTDDPTQKVIKDENKVFAASITGFNLVFNAKDKTIELDMKHTVDSKDFAIPHLKGALGNLKSAKNFPEAKAHLVSDNPATQDYVADVACTDLKNDPGCNSASILIRKMSGDMKGVAAVDYAFFPLPGVPTREVTHESTDKAVLALQSLYTNKDVKSQSSLMKLITVRNGSTLYGLTLQFYSDDNQTEVGEVNLSGVIGDAATVTIAQEIKTKDSTGKETSDQAVEDVSPVKVTWDKTAKKIEIALDGLDIVAAPTEDAATATSTATSTSTSTATSTDTSTGTSTATGTSTGSGTGTTTSTGTGTHT